LTPPAPMRAAASVRERAAWPPAESAGVRR
jgi:hypothetical protein